MIIKFYCDLLIYAMTAKFLDNQNPKRKRKINIRTVSGGYFLQYWMGYCNAAVSYLTCQIFTSLPAFGRNYLRVINYFKQNDQMICLKC